MHLNLETTMTCNETRLVCVKTDAPFLAEIWTPTRQSKVFAGIQSDLFLLNTISFNKEDWRQTSRTLFSSTMPVDANVIHMGKEVVAKHQECHSFLVISALTGVPERTCRSIPSQRRTHRTVQDLPCKGAPSQNQCETRRSPVTAGQV